MRTNLKLGAIYTRRTVEPDDDLSVLAKSIKTDGLKYPILVDENYFLIDGLRRLKAMDLNERDLVPVIVAETYREAIDAIADSHSNVDPSAIPVYRLWELQHDLSPIMRKSISVIRRTPFKDREIPESNRSRKMLADALGITGSTLQVLSTLHTSSLSGSASSEFATELLKKVKNDELTPHAAKSLWATFQRDLSSVRQGSAQTNIMNKVVEIMPGVLNSLKELSSEFDSTIKMSDLARWEDDLSNHLRLLREVLNKVRRAKERIN